MKRTFRQSTIERRIATTRVCPRCGKDVPPTRILSAVYCGESCQEARPRPDRYARATPEYRAKERRRSLAYFDRMRAAYHAVKELGLIKEV